MEIPKEVQEAFEMAKTTRENAYAVYSNYKVGAALKFKNSDKIYAGCNVENSSFGATICAERTALTSGVADGCKGVLEFVVLVTDNEESMATPCGMCLQMLSEFADKDTKVYLSNLSGVKKAHHFFEFLPLAFTKDKLPGFES